METRTREEAKARREERVYNTDVIALDGDKMREELDPMFDKVEQIKDATVRGAKMRIRNIEKWAVVFGSELDRLENRIAKNGTIFPEIQGVRSDFNTVMSLLKMEKDIVDPDNDDDNDDDDNNSGAKTGAAINKEENIDVDHTVKYPVGCKVEIKRGEDKDVVVEVIGHGDPEEFLVQDVTSPVVKIKGIDKNGVSFHGYQEVENVKLVEEEPETMKFRLTYWTGEQTTVFFESKSERGAKGMAMRKIKADPAYADMRDKDFEFADGTWREQRLGERWTRTLPRIENQKVYRHAELYKMRDEDPEPKQADDQVVRSYTANDRGEEIVEATVRVADLVNSLIPKAEAHQRIAYFNSLERNVQDGYGAGCGTEGDTVKDRLIGAIATAWIQSPGEVEKRRVAKQAYDTELLTCSRSGEQVQRQHGVMVGDTFTAFAQLTDAEAEFLNIDKTAYVEVEKEKNRDPRAYKMVYVERKGIGASFHTNMYLEYERQCYVLDTPEWNKFEEKDLEFSIGDLFKHRTNDPKCHAYILLHIEALRSVRERPNNEPAASTAGDAKQSVTSEPEAVVEETLATDTLIHKIAERRWVKSYADETLAKDLEADIKQIAVLTGEPAYGSHVEHVLVNSVKNVDGKYKWKNYCRMANYRGVGIQKAIARKMRVSEDKATEIIAKIADTINANK